MSDPFKPGSYFGRPLRSEGFEKIFGLTGAAALARPSAPSFSVASGMNDGEIDLTVLALPSSWGDLAVAGDGLGLPGWLEWRNEVTGWALLHRAPAWTSRTGSGSPIYINSSGNDTTGTGSAAAPYATLAKALSVVATSGTILLSSDITLPNTATYNGVIISVAGLTIASDIPGIRRTLDMSAMLSDATTGGNGISFRGANQTILGLRFTGYAPTFGGAPSDYVAGVNTRGTGFTAIDCEFDHIAGRGMALGESGTPTNSIVLGCDFHHCLDPFSSSPYGNADGLQIFAGAAHTGITITACRFWANSDDGTDLFFAQAPLTVIGSISYGNGFRADGVTIGGDGTGFKLGGATYSVAHVITDSLAYDNAGGGFSTNDNTGAVAMRRCTSIDNGRAGNAYPASFIADGSSTAILEDCVKYGGYPNWFGGSVTQSYNSWNTPPGIGAESAAWFVSLNRSLPSFACPAIGGPLLTAGHTGAQIGWTAAQAVQIAPTPLGTPIILDLPAELWGSTATISLRGVSAAGRAGSVATQTVVVPGALQTLDSLVMPDTSPVEYLSDGPMTVLVPA